MIKIKLIVPRKNYINNAYERFERHNELEPAYQLENEIIEFKFEEVVIPAGNLNQLDTDADVLMSRGLMSKLIKEISGEIPVVDIPVQGIDLIQCLVECKEKFGRKKVAVIGAMNMIFGVESLENIIDLPIQKYVLNDIKHSKEVVDLAASENCEVVISGLSTCAYAEEIGLNAMIVETGEASFNQALDEAKRLAVVSRIEQEKFKRYQTILDHAFEGVIAIDLYQKISLFNSAAINILTISQNELIGKQIKDVLHKGPLLNLLLNKESYKEDIVAYKGIQLSVKKIAIKLKGRKVGDMVAFQDVTGIQKMEGEIRKKIYLRGHIAKYTFNDIIYKSDVVDQTIEIAKSYSEVDSNILIIGETGTGKEMYTQSIHNQSARKDKPFVAINCAALPESLLESELFGYAEGAFTGAMKGGKQGIFELAHQGTLFLDEIGEISANLQSRLLRVLQEREVMRIGDDKVIPVDVRIIAATNKNLLEMVKNNKFREDLYYRLSVLDLHLPPLRECKEDIPLLASHFINKYSHQDEPIIVTDSAYERLKQVDWDGNIRQLENFCERLSVLNKGNVIDVDEIEKNLPNSYLSKDDNERNDYSSLEDSFLLSEKQRIITALKNNHFHRGNAAKELGMSRSTLWRKLKQHNIETN